MDDRDLLQEYVERQSERAFAELVARHVDFVYATARRVAGERALAEDVVQTVFIQLARKAWSIRDGKALPGWLYRAAYHAACAAVRGEQRRRRREAEAMSLTEQNTPDATVWTQLAPLLDEAMQRLSQAEQDAVAQRFFQGKTLRETGAALGTSEAAAQMRVTRALEKMRTHFRRRGCTVTTEVLALELAARTSLASPAGLAASVTQNALAGAAKAGMVNAAAKFIYMSTKTKIIIAAAVVAALAFIPLERQQQEIAQLREQLASAQTGKKPLRHSAAAEAAGSSAVTAGNAAGNSKGTAPATPEAARAAFVKILTQPGYVTRLRGLLNLADQITNETDIRSILHAINQMPDTDLKGQAAEIFIRRWAEMDPAGALATISALPGDAKYRGSALMPVFDALLEKDPASAINTLGQIDDPTIRGIVQLHILNEVALSNPQASFGYLQSLPADQQSSDLYEAVFTPWAMNDPAAAAGAAAGLPPGKLRNAALNTVAGSWIHQDAQAATAWVASLPSGSEQDTAAAGVAAAWTLSNPAAASQWINELPPGSMRDSATAQWASREAGSDPAAAFAQAASIGDTDTRQETLLEVTKDWARADLAGVTNAIQGSTLPEAQKNKLLRKAQSEADSDN